MEQQSTQEIKPNISRCTARHLRRKRLIVARRALADDALDATKNLKSNIIQETRDDTQQETNDKLPLTKSKSRRLRKKKKLNSLKTSNKITNNFGESSDLKHFGDGSSEANVQEARNEHENLSNLQIDIVKNIEIVPTSLSIDNVSPLRQKLETIHNIELSKEHGLLSPREIALSRSEQHTSVEGNNYNIDPCSKINSFSSKLNFKESFDTTETSRLTDTQFNECEKQSRSSSLDTLKFQKKSWHKSNSRSREKNLFGTDAVDGQCTAVKFDDVESSSEYSQQRIYEKELLPSDQEFLENQKNLIVSGNPNLFSNSLLHNTPSINHIESKQVITNLPENSSLNNDSNISRAEQQMIMNSIPDSAIESVPPTNPDLVSTPEECSLRRKGTKKSKTNNDAKCNSLEPNVSIPKCTLVNTISAPSRATKSIQNIPPESLAAEKSSTSLPTLTSENTCTVPDCKSTMESVGKTKEQIKAEREARKAAKAASKIKGGKPIVKKEKDDVPDTSVGITGEKIEKHTKSLTTYSTREAPASSTQQTQDSGVNLKEDVREIKTEEKSKAELRAERRAKQEAQRAAKEKSALEKNKPKIVEPAKTTSPFKPSNVMRKLIVNKARNDDVHEVKLFKHLYHERQQSFVNVLTLNSDIHPAIVRLGVQYANRVIAGSNARCIALLAAVKQLIQDFERPSQADFTRGLEASLLECGAYLHHCRPLAVSMQNALRHLKWQMTQLSSTISDNEAKAKLGNAIDTYIKEQIQLADKAISITIQTKISNGDVILTYGYSSLVHKILCDAHTANRQFRVVIVDGRPWLEGKEQLRRLAKHGIECSYILINALSFIMPEVSKVFLGAHAILANGAVMSRAGTAQVALMAKAFNVPVLVACETHKSCERVQTDSIVYNEIGDADELSRNLPNTSKKSPLLNWRKKKSLNLLNITYDVTPADLVTAVVTELAILPCTSVPVILRIKPSEI